MADNSQKPAGWAPSFSLEERLKQLFVPPSLYRAYRSAKERRRGEAEFALIPNLCSPHMTSIDVGANIGVWTWAMARESSHVHAFEPNPKNIARLRRNLGGLKNVSLHGVALSDRDGEASLRIPRGPKGHSNQRASLSRIAVGDDKPFTALTVEARRLDDFAITNVGFMKIDVEGFEQAVLDGARQTIARDRPNLLVEIEEAHTNVPLGDSVRRVAALGYRCLYLRRGVLTCFSRLDAEAEHRNPPRRQDYVFNFIFLPE